MRESNMNASELRALAPYASMPDLAKSPDCGAVALLIPVLIKEEGSLRDLNFRFLLRQYSESKTLIIAQQHVKGTKNFLSEVIKELAPSAIHHVLETESDLVHKSQLVNEGANIAFSKLKARYVWQIDADIFINIVPVLRQLEILNSKAVPVIKPLLHFSRLDKTATRDLTNSSAKNIAAFDPPGPERTLYKIETLFGPGTIIFTQAAFKKIGGMDDSYTGWGWEDMDFSERLAEHFPVHTLPFRGIHLHHEEDRIRNPDNADRFFDIHRGSTSAFEKERILAHTHFDNILHKFCVISAGASPIVEALSRSLAQHSEISSTEEIFSPEALDKNYPIQKFGPNAFHKHIVLSLGKTEAKHSGFVYVPRTLVHPPYFEPDAISPEHILEFLVANGFKLILLQHNCLIDCMVRESGHYLATLTRYDYDLDTARQIAEDQVKFFQARYRSTLKTISRFSRKHGIKTQNVALEISDSDLTESWDTTMSKILEFLELDSLPPLERVQLEDASLENDVLETHIRFLRTSRP